MKTRIKKVRKDNSQTQQSFAQILKVSYASVQSWELGRTYPTSASVELICEKFNVNRKWLETGVGEPYVPQTDNQMIAEWVNRVMADKDEAFRKRFICSLSNMSDAGWDALEKFFDDLNWF